MNDLIKNPPTAILVTECRISCPTCKTPLADSHPAVWGLIRNKCNSIRSELVSLRATKKTAARDLKINKMVQDLFNLDPEDAERFIENCGRHF